jgi:ABC-2 type transport system ATP-binding protein
VFLTTHYMDEAQHLADRLTILRAGEIVAQGTPTQLSARSGGTVIRFTLPSGIGVDRVEGATGIRAAVSGVEVTLRCAGSPQRVLYQLTGWAERDHIALEDLEVSRPTLDDVFLELTQQAGP